MKSRQQVHCKSSDDKGKFRAKAKGSIEPCVLAGLLEMIADDFITIMDKRPCFCIWLPLGFESFFDDFGYCIVPFSIIAQRRPCTDDLIIILV